MRKAPTSLKFLHSSELSRGAQTGPPPHIYALFMGSRLIAATVLIAGLALVAWVALGGGGDDELVVESTPTESDVASPDSGSSADSADGSDRADAPATTDDSAAEPLAAATAAPEPATTDPPEPELELENLGPRMGLVNLDGWLNTDIGSLDDLDGQVVLVEMWTFGCRNCKARIPYNQQYYEEFNDQGFEIVGVHAPEFSWEADIANIEQALVDLGVTWPVALDTTKVNFHRWQAGPTGYWPRSILIDQNGDIRYDHIGEGKYEELREAIAHLIDNPPPPIAS